MKTSYLSLSLAALTTFVFTQCKKDDAGPAPVNFSPLTTSSSWTYKYTEGSRAATTFRLTALNKDTIVASGKTYKVLTSSDGGPNNYLGKDGSNYYRFASFPSLGINNFEELYLKDNESVNGKWTGEANINYMGAALKANLVYTIKGKGESRTVLGKAYNNVVYVRLDIALFGSNAGGGDFYYAEGIGMIENTILVTPPPITGGQPYSSHQELVSHEIK
ncbi:MAG: hypothetical protein JWQ40_4382 [Segetibacter sp.]|jgi:hypothetical protein|nr:hypothetical protein [Segetibacter sp.]